MKPFIQQFRAESFKLKRWFFYLLHLLIPSAGIVVFSLYTKVTSYSLASLQHGYLQILALIYPVAAAWMCSIIYEPEIQAGHGYFLLSAKSRSKVLAVKLFYLLIFGLFSCIIATGGYGLVSFIINQSKDSPINEIIQAGFLIWGCSIFLYLFHSWLHLKFSRNASFAVSAIEILLSALMLTGLGDGRWYFIPGSWGIRFLNMKRILESNSITYELLGKIENEAAKGRVISIMATLVGCILLFFWFSHWEGRKSEE